MSTRASPSSTHPSSAKSSLFLPLLPLPVAPSPLPLPHFPLTVIAPPPHLPVPIAPSQSPPPRCHLSSPTPLLPLLPLPSPLLAFASSSASLYLQLPPLLPVIPLHAQSRYATTIIEPLLSYSSKHPCLRPPAPSPHPSSVILHLSSKFQPARPCGLASSSASDSTRLPNHPQTFISID